ncbi:MAG: dihydrofolate reductase family protein [Fimbriimonadaceae bacterium]|nr:dihydrofolate reductase family protein [Fimbriimonadaceae bacterium]
MPLTIPVAHDFVCPWCWVGLHQVRRLQAEFGVQIDWRGYELYPPELPYPDHYTRPAAPEPVTNRPVTPSRLALMYAAEGIVPPTRRGPFPMRTTQAHQASEFAKAHGKGDAFIERLYRAYWTEAIDIERLDFLRDVAREFGFDLAAFEHAVRNGTYRHLVVPFDDAAYGLGVYNVPTFFIGRERLAEQPYTVLAEATRHAVAAHGGQDAYWHLEFPAAPKDRPYVYLNMITTIDGKILSGERNESVHDLGSKVDKQMMHRIEASADAVLVGAETLRATPFSWNPGTEVRIVVTKTGRIPAEAVYLRHGRPYVAMAGSAEFSLPPGVQRIRAGGAELDFAGLLHRVRALGVQRLLVLGGSEINAQLLHAGLVDEIFMTLAPKIKLGRDVPTLADGEALPRHAIQNYDLVEHHPIGNEIFLRYRRAK